MMSSNDEMRFFWEWKRRELLVKLIQRKQYKTWEDFEHEWNDVKDKIAERPEKNTFLFSDYIHWKTKGKPCITEILPDKHYVKAYFDERM